MTGRSLLVGLAALLLVAGAFASPAHASFSLIAHTGAQSSDGVSATTAGINTTGATLLVVAVANLFGNSPSFTDSNSNTWSALTPRDTGSGCRVTLYYVANPTVGAGHTFSVNVGGGSQFPAITVVAWAGNAASGPETENGATASATTIATGSVTPALTNGLIVAAACHSEVFASSVDSGFTISDDEPRRQQPGLRQHHGLHRRDVDRRARPELLG